MSPTPQFLFASFRLDPANARLWCGSQARTLTPKAFAVCSIWSNMLDS